MSRTLLLTLALFGVAAADFVEVPHKNCKSIADLKSLQASGCTLVDEVIKDETKKVCIFKAGTKPTIKISFTPTAAVPAELETNVRAKFGKSTLPYKMTEWETCKHGGITCPLEVGKEAVYSQEFHIDPSYPTDELFQVNWTIGNGEDKQVCLVFLARINA